MSIKDPKSLVLEYHDAFHRGDRPAVRRLLKENGKFIGPLSSFTNADTFLDAAAIFWQLSKKTQIKQIIAEGNDICVLYDYTTIVPSIPVLPLASWFKVESGKVTFFHVHFDPTAFVKAQERGDIAKALQLQKEKVVAA